MVAFQSRCSVEFLIVVSVVVDFCNVNYLSL